MLTYNTWAVGSTYQINLNATDLALYDLTSDPINPTILSYVKIELSRDLGSTWETLAANYHNVSGFYSWTISGAISSTCYLRISDPADSNNSGIGQLFAIGYSETAARVPVWGIGKTHNIALTDIYVLTSDPENPTPLPYVKIELSRDIGGTWETVAANYHNTTGLYPWTVAGPAADYCYLRISDPSDSNNNGTGTLFSIGAVENVGASNQYSKLSLAMSLSL